MEFHEQQIRAISHNCGPMMVLAGPGSGKTTVITHRVKHLIEQWGVDPRRILVITFTRAAAGEMKTRFENLMKADSKGEGRSGILYPVSFGTFHAVFFQILKYAYGLRGDNIIREEQKYAYIHELVEQQRLEVDDVKEFEQGILDEISIMKSEMMDLNHYYSKNCPEETFRKLYLGYTARLEREGLIDFDDMLVKCYELLRERPDILRRWQERYQYILIDEFQDINRIQYEVVKLLASPEDNLFIVGDDDQSIYRFRGAKPEIMLRFPKDFPGTKQVLLGINYRSTQNIVKAAGRIIRNNKMRYEKQIVTRNEIGKEPVVREFVDTRAETLRVVGEVQAYLKEGYCYKDIAFLFRTNTDPRPLVERLMEYNIPFHMKDTLPNLYEHWIAKDFFAYIHIVLGSRRRSDFLRIMNKPKRYVSRDALQESEIDFYFLKQRYADKYWMVKRLEELEMQLAFMEQMAPAAAIHYIRQAIGYDSYLEEYAKYRRMEVQELYDVAEQIEESARDYRDFDSWFTHIDAYGEQLKEQAKERNAVADSVEIATMHGAKGLEYPIVYLLDANEGVSPHHKAFLEEDMEEERRLFYVAVTRAKERLHIYSVKERYRKPVAVSRFVGEMLIDMEAIKEGAEVIHNKYGSGTIRKVTDGKMAVFFPKLRKEMTFDIKFVLANQIIKTS